MKKIIKIDKNNDYRIVVISDIHGGLDLLKRLINKVSLKKEDYLIILGDTLQRGSQNIETLEYMKNLANRQNTIILSGNHERYILSLLDEKRCEKLDYHLKNIKYPCIIKEWMKELAVEYKSIDDAIEIQNKIKDRYKDELDFMKSLPVALEFDEFIFVHAGVENIDNWKESKVESLLAIKSFLDLEHKSSKYVVVGHWPTQNYRHRSLSGNVIIDNNKKIISIDGGFGVKYVGQMNALIIEKKDNQITFKSTAEDNFKTAKISKDFHIKNDNIVKLDWQDNEFEFIKKEEEFSVCKKVSTQETFLLKNEFIKDISGKLSISYDVVSLFLDVKKGENIKVIGCFGKYVFGKYKNEIGWVKADCVNL